MAMARALIPGPKLVVGRGFVLALLMAVVAECGLVLICAACAHSAATIWQAPEIPNSSPANQAQPQDQGDSSSRSSHRKTGPNSSETIRHTKVVDEDAASAELAKAQDLIEKRDYASAEPLLRQAVDSEPANYEAWFDLGYVENALGKQEDSIAAYRKSLAAKPDVFESNLNLGLQLAKTGQPDAARFLRAATQLKPTDHVNEGQERAWLSLGHVLEPTTAEEALAAYRKAAALQPKDAEPHLSAGLLLEKQGKAADAIAEYKQALALSAASDPAAEHRTAAETQANATETDALTGLANVYMHSRQFPEAEKCLRELVVVRPQDAGAHIQLGRVLAAQSKNDAALAELEAGEKLAPADESLERDLADLYSATGKNHQAESIYRKLLASHANDAELHRSLGHVLVLQQKFPEAQKEFVTAVNLKPDFGEAYGDLAFAAGENRDFALVIKALDARAKLLPEIPITYFFRASAYDHLKDFKRAAANYHLFLNTADGKYPDQEWQAKHRLVTIEPKK